MGIHPIRWTETNNGFSVAPRLKNHYSLSGITVAKLEVHGKTYLKLSRITPFAHKLLTLCRVPSLETLLGE